MSDKTPALDVSFWADPEPLDIKYLDKTYHASFDMSSVLHARISNWVFTVAGMDPGEAERLSITLTALALNETEAEVATIKPVARKTILGFLANGLRPAPATTQ